MGRRIDISRKSSQSIGVSGPSLAGFKNGESHLPILRKEGRYTPHFLCMWEISQAMIPGREHDRSEAYPWVNDWHYAAEPRELGGHRNHDTPHPRSERGRLESRTESPKLLEERVAINTVTGLLGGTCKMIATASEKRWR